MLSILESPPAVLAGWEVAKGVMTTLSTAGILGVLTLCFSLRDAVRDLKRDVSGHDGKNGIKSVVAELEERVGELEMRNAEREAVERAQYEGPERRHGARRLSDQRESSSQRSAEGGR